MTDPQTDSSDIFLELINSICRRPRMHTIDGTYAEVCAYILGYCQGSTDSPLSDERYQSFNQFVTATFRFPDKYVWPFVIRECSRTDEDATEKLRCLLNEFVERTKTISPEDLVEEILSRSLDHVEGEPEMIWRRFYCAMLEGDKDKIEPLIMEHRNAGILWKAAYPEEVAETLKEIANSNPVTRISGSEEEGCVVIITHDLGPMKLIRIDGSWRIDVSKLIEIRMWRKEMDMKENDGPDHQPADIDQT